MSLWRAGSSLTEAWALSGSFWRQTFADLVRHAGVVLLFAAPVAIQRAWILLRARSIPAWRNPSIEVVVFLWRLLMCIVAAWIVITPAQAASLRIVLHSNARIQTTLGRLGASIGTQLRLLSWEILFAAAAFFLLNWLLTAAATLCVQIFSIDPGRKENWRVAFVSVVRNFLLVPVALIYVAVAIRHALTHA